MSIISRVRRQTCVYWAPNTAQGYDGNTTGWASPIEMSCRWTNKERYHVLENGTQVVTQSKIMTEIATTKGGYLMLGELTDVTSSTDPREQDGAYEIMAVETIPNLRNTENLEQAYLTWQK